MNSMDSNGTVGWIKGTYGAWLAMVYCKDTGHTMERTEGNWLRFGKHDCNDCAGFMNG
jgi:hypothetical protein